MSAKNLRGYDAQGGEAVSVRAIDNGDGTFSPAVSVNLITPDADITQLITVATSGSPVQGPAKTNPGGWYLAPGTTNTGAVYFMYHGQTKATKGMPIAQLTPVPVSDLSSLDFDADTSGNIILASKA